MPIMPIKTRAFLQEYIFLKKIEKRFGGTAFQVLPLPPQNNHTRYQRVLKVELRDIKSSLTCWEWKEDKSSKAVVIERG
jgi:hypothetical protein